MNNTSAALNLNKKALKNVQKNLSSSPSTICRKRVNTQISTTTKFIGKQFSNLNSPTIINACYTPSSLYRNANSGSKCRRALDLSEAQNSKNPNIEHVANGDDRLTVAVRVRPLNAQECLLPNVTNVARVNGNELTILVGTSADSSCGVNHSFVYDRVFDSCHPGVETCATQQDVYEGTAKPLIQRAFEGYNACLFAYGQTGSGKSYNMMGVDTFLETEREDALNLEAGIIPRYCYDIFQHIKKSKEKFHVEVEISFFEIYNEKIHDLLCVGENDDITLRNERKALKVREHPIWGPYVVGLSVHPVDSYEALRNWLILGNSQRASAATFLNEKSSRSHSIFNIMLNITDTHLTTSLNTNDSKNYHSRKSKVSLVDLAGSERINNSSGERKREGVHINKSLLTLGKVIAALSSEKTSGTGKAFVPYRESALTWLLRVTIL